MLRIIVRRRGSFHNVNRHMKRFTCIVLVATLFSPALSAQSRGDVATHPSSEDALIRGEQRVVQVDFANGSKATGHIGSIEKRAFYIVPPDRTGRGQRIRYSEVATVKDSVTGERLIQAGPLRKASAGGVRPGFKALIIVGIGVGVLLLVCYLGGGFAS